MNTFITESNHKGGRGVRKPEYFYLSELIKNPVCVDWPCTYHGRNRRPTEIQDGSKARWENPNILHVHNQQISKKRPTKAGATRCQQETDLTAFENVECNAR